VLRFYGGRNKFECLIISLLRLKGNMSKLIFNPITFLGITIISIIFSISLYKSAKRTSYSAENIKSIEEEVLKTEAEVLALEIAIEESQQPFIEEKIIRNELLMKKPGEYVIQIPNELIEQTQTTIEVKTLSPWEEWQQLLF
jgi:cell division protein FtsB